MARLMIVDDMAVFREPVAAALAKHGYQTMTAEGGETALKAIHQQRPDLILLDMSMPDIDGLEVLRQLHKNPQHQSIPVIMLTDASERKYIIQAIQLGADDYILKSDFSLKRLLDRIEKQLNISNGVPAPPPLTHDDDDFDIEAAGSFTGESENPALDDIPKDANASQIIEHIQKSDQLSELLADVDHTQP